jgi:hypothetical protein
MLVACTFRHGTDMAPPDAAVDSAVDTASAAPIVIEAEAYTIEIDGPTHAWTSTTTIAGFSGSAYMQCTPGTGNLCMNDGTLAACAASMKYAFTITAAATYHVHVRTLGTSSSDDSAWYGIDDVPAADALMFVADSTWHWMTGATTYPLLIGPHTLTIWQRECGARVDVVAVSPSATPPP